MYTLLGAASEVLNQDVAQHVAHHVHCLHAKSCSVVQLCLRGARAAYLRFVHCSLPAVPASAVPSKQSHACAPLGDTLLAMCAWATMQFLVSYVSGTHAFVMCSVQHVQGILYCCIPASCASCSSFCCCSLSAISRMRCSCWHSACHLSAWAVRSARICSVVSLVAVISRSSRLSPYMNRCSFRRRTSPTSPATYTSGLA